MMAYEDIQWLVDSGMHPDLIAQRAGLKNRESLYVRLGRHQDYQRREALKRLVETRGTPSWSKRYCLPVMDRVKRVMY